MRQRPLRNRILRVLSAVVLLSALCLAAAGGARAQSPVALATLPNGLRVLTAPSHAVGLVAIDLWVRAGATRQPQGAYGIAHYLEHVLFKGTPTRPDESQIDGAIEDLGGSLNAATSFDWAHFYVVVPSANFAPALAIMSDVIQHADISDKNVQSERPVILSEVARQLDSPQEVLNAHLREMVYGKGHPYAAPVTGSPADVQAVTRDQILNFYKTYYAPNNVSLVVSGDVTPDQVQKEALKVFGTWMPATRLDPPPLPPTPAQTSIHRAILRRSAPSSYLSIAFPAPSVKDRPDAWAMDVLLTLLGQGAGNRLERKLHNELKLVDSISADYLTQANPGILTITASFPSGNPDAVEKAIVAEVGRLRTEPVSASDLDGAKQSLLASYLFDVQTVSGRADALGFYEAIDTYEYDVDYIKRFEAVTPDDIRMLANKYLTTDWYNIVTIVPFSDPSNAKLPAGAGVIRTASK